MGIARQWSTAAALLVGSGGVLAAPSLDYAAARHLLTRTGFGATDAEIRGYTGLGREQAVARLLQGVRTTAVTPIPAALNEFVRPGHIKALPDDERKAVVAQQFIASVELRTWWLREMLDTPSPLTERMTLFWHNHFVSAQTKVKSPVLMLRQNLLLRQHAVGNFATLLHAVARDPAMLVYLDNAQNRKAEPNENFAREVMELFTLGEGRYGERDVKEAARAFTGWSLDPDDGTFVFRRFQHDGGDKTVLGRTGNLDGDDVLDVLLAQPACAEFIVGKLWHEFVSPEPDAAEVTRIAAVLRNARYDIRTALRLLLTSDAFYAPDKRAVLIKSPVELVVGTLHGFGVETGELAPFAFLTAALGQNLFSPPNVKGWPGGETWINSTTLLQRRQFLDRLFRGEDLRGADGMKMGKDVKLARGGGQLDAGERRRLLQGLTDLRFDAGAWMAGLRNPGAAGVVAAVLPVAPVASVPDGTSGLELIRALTQDAVYQLK